MKKQRFGVEVEMNNITREKAARIASALFGTDNYSYTGDEDGYSTWSAYDSQGRKWMFQKDVSISGLSDEQCELVTPILTYDDIPLLQELCRKLRDAGAKSNGEYRRCGIHIHVDASGQTAKSLRILTNMMNDKEKMLIKALKLSRHRINDYCKPVDKKFLERLNYEKPMTVYGLKDIWYNTQAFGQNMDHHYNSSRYHMLNLHAFFTKGTIEFRLFQFDHATKKSKNNIHAGHLKAYIQFCLALCDTAKMIAEERKVYRGVMFDDEYKEMTCWLEWLGLETPEFRMLRKFFTRRLEKSIYVAA